MKPRLKLMPIKELKKVTTALAQLPKEAVEGVMPKPKQKPGRKQ
jgi:hypothetical protein